MASKKSFSVENPDAITNFIRRLDTAGSEDTLRKAGRAAITEFVKEVRLRVPRDTGDLAEGVTAAFIEENSATGQVVTYRMLFMGDTQKKGKRGDFVSRRALAGWLENGTSRIAPRPFVRPAFEAVREKAASDASAVIVSAVNGEGTK